MPTPDTVVILDDHSFQVEGDVEIMTTGSSKTLALKATESGSNVQIKAADKVVMTVGPATITVDSAKKQAVVQGIQSVKLGVGPPAELGAVIDMTPTSIDISLLKVVKVSLSALGVEIKAYESSLKVDATGITLKGPLIQESAEAAKKVSTALEQQQASATRQFNAGVDMLG